MRAGLYAYCSEMPIDILYEVSQGYIPASLTYD